MYMYDCTNCSFPVLSQSHGSASTIGQKLPLVEQFLETAIIVLDW